MLSWSLLEIESPKYCTGLFVVFSTYSDLYVQFSFNWF